MDVDTSGFSHARGRRSSGLVRLLAGLLLGGTVYYVAATASIEAQGAVDFLEAEGYEVIRVIGDGISVSGSDDCNLIDMKRVVAEVTPPDQVARVTVVVCDGVHTEPYLPGES